MKGDTMDKLPDLELGPRIARGEIKVPEEAHDAGIVSMKEYIKDPETPAVPKLSTEMDMTMELLQEAVQGLFLKIDPILTPGEIEHPTLESISGVSNLAKSISTWKDRLAGLTDQINRITERVEL
jgi:hypothetical protein